MLAPLLSFIVLEILPRPTDTPNSPTRSLGAADGLAACPAQVAAQIATAAAEPLGRFAIGAELSTIAHSLPSNCLAW
ncbi:hypothetical protein GCM10027088_61630 [Nocardia goodfellowii]